MKYTIKILSALLAVTLLFSLMACENIYDQVAATATQKAEDKSSTKKPVIVTNKDGGYIIEAEDDDKTENNSSTTKNNDKTTTTRPTTTKPTTTKKKVIEKIPSTVAEILSEYNKAANRTKAAKNMTVDKTNDVEIVIDEFAGSAALAGMATNLAGSFMKQYNGQSAREVYVNGKPTRNTTEYDLQYTNTLCNDKKLFIPVRNKSYMCNLSPSDVISATATRLSASTYKVVIKLKSESTDLNTPPAIITRGMDYFEQKVFDLGMFEFVGGTAVYENCVITGIVNAEGYLDYAENKMSVSSTDAKVTKLEIDAKLHGDYITTLKFSNIK